MARSSTRGALIKEKNHLPAADGFCLITQLFILPFEFQLIVLSLHIGHALGWIDLCYSNIQ